MENVAKKTNQEQHKERELDATLAKIATDAGNDPASYLEETKVPEGGE